MLLRVCNAWHIAINRRTLRSRRACTDFRLSGIERLGRLGLQHTWMARNKGREPRAAGTEALAPEMALGLHRHEVAPIHVKNIVQHVVVVMLVLVILHCHDLHIASASHQRKPAQAVIKGQHTPAARNSEADAKPADQPTSTAHAKDAETLLYMLFLIDSAETSS